MKQTAPGTVRHPHRRYGWPTAVAAVVLFAAACGGSGQAHPQVMPSKDVQASAFVFDTDPNNPDQVVFRMTTTTTMICSIAWGESPSLGHFNSDRSMNGTGIVEHNAVLSNAKTGTTYFFRVQRSTA